MKAYIFPFPDTVIPFLKACNYPNPDWINPIHLEQATIIQLVSDRGDLAGFIWFNWANSAGTVLGMHLCILPRWRGRWLNRHVLVLLRSYIELLGAAWVEARPTDDTLPLARRVLPKLGFVETSNNFYLEINDGVPLTQKAKVDHPEAPA